MWPDHRPVPGYPDLADRGPGPVVEDLANRASVAAQRGQQTLHGGHRSPAGSVADLQGQGQAVVGNHGTEHALGTRLDHGATGTCPDEAGAGPRRAGDMEGLGPHGGQEAGASLAAAQPDPAGGQAVQRHRPDGNPATVHSWNLRRQVHLAGVGQGPGHVVGLQRMVGRQVAIDFAGFRSIFVMEDLKNTTALPLEYVGSGA